MRILIIEDSRWCALLMAEVLVGLGEITVFTKPSLEKVGGDFLKVRMPPMEKVLELLKEADMVLLDQDLMTSYSGKDLLPYCDGKKVVSISVSTIPGLISWTRKLEMGSNNPEEATRHRESLKDLITRARVSQS